MYRACNQLFACACFTRDEDRRITRRDFGDARENTFQSGRCSNDVFKHRGLADLLTERDVFLAKPVFRLLAVFNVSTCAVPSCYVTPFIFKRTQTEQKPAKYPIVPQHPSFELMWRAFEKLALSLAEKLFAILWMKETISGGFGSPSVHVDTQILERHAIGIEWGSIRRKDSEVLRHEVQHLPELCFTSAPFLLCSFTLSKVDHSAHKFNEMAGRAQNRMS